MRKFKFKTFVEGKWYCFTLDEIIDKAMTYQGSFIIKLLNAKKWQSTNLFDKNGTEIYEGDLVRNYYINGGIEDEEYIEWYIDSYKWGHFVNISVALSSGRTSEVIGHIINKGKQ